MTHDAEPPTPVHPAALSQLAATAAAVLMIVLAVVAALAVSGRLGGSGPCVAQSHGSCTRVLFVGNSYTYVNDLPAAFRDLAVAGGHRVETAMVAPGGATLADHVRSGDADAALSGSRWDLVVLQEQSEVPANEAMRQQQMYPAGRRLAADAAAVGASTLLLETWAHRDGWVDGGLPSYEAMQAQVDAGYRALATDLRSPMAPVGEAWQAVHGQHPELELWQADGTHPSTSGTYLAACVLYAAVFHGSPVGLPPPAGITNDVARVLQAAAAATVLGAASR